MSRKIKTATVDDNYDGAMGGCFFSILQSLLPHYSKTLSIAKVAKLQSIRFLPPNNVFSRFIANRFHLGEEKKTGNFLKLNIGKRYGVCTQTKSQTNH